MVNLEAVSGLDMDFGLSLIWDTCRSTMLSTLLTREPCILGSVILLDDPLCWWVIISKMEVTFEIGCVEEEDSSGWCRKSLS